MSERFYIDCPLQPGLVELTGPEAHHLAVVCRLRPGDALCLFNGDGREYPARIRDVHRRAVAIEVLEVVSTPRELGFSLTVAAPLLKGDRSQFLIEKLTELGVTSFVPLSTERSSIRPGEHRLDKLQRYVVEASKQCGRNVLLRIEPMAPWEVFCRQPDLHGLRLLANFGGAPLPELQAAVANVKEVTLAVGPEGGFTLAEADAAITAGWLTVSLGPRILRAETAALALAGWLALRGQVH